MDHNNLFYRIISLENLFASWCEFKADKRNKSDVQEFERHLEDNMFSLHKELSTKKYRHSEYNAFYVTDPKVRHIHKASVKDRVVHHAVFRILYPIFDNGLIYDTYSCRFKKGTHRAVERLSGFIRKTNQNHAETCFALKCDIKKFFDSVNHEALMRLIKKKILDQDTIWLLEKVIKSYHKEENFQQKLFDPAAQTRERERDGALR